MNEKNDPVRKDHQEMEEKISGIKECLSENDLERAAFLLNHMEPEDIAEILSEFPSEDKLRLFDLLLPDAAAVVLDDTDPQSRLQILQNSDKEKIALVLDEMPVDEAADVIEEFSEEQREDLLDLMEKEDAEEVEEILGYPEDSAGRVMVPNYISVKEDDDVEDALSYIRGSRIEEEFYYVYVVDSGNRLKGVVPLRKLILSPKGTVIKDIMETDVHSVFVDTDQEQASIIIKKYDLFSLPVVNEKKELVGRITVDDIIDVIEEERGEDISKMTGTIEEERGTESTFMATQNRLPWLITCMFGSILTGLVIQMYEITLTEMIALVSFIPVITATGGNSGVQASTVVVRGIALGHMDLSKLGEEIWRQFKIALTLGLVCGFLLSIVANFWKSNSMVGFITGISIFLVVVWSNFVGVSVPVIFKKLNIDPAIASGPLITTMNDVVGVLIYLNVATMLLK